MEQREGSKILGVMMPENDQRTVEQKVQFKNIYGWQREMMLAEESLQVISQYLRLQGLDGAPDWVKSSCEDEVFSERQRHRFLQKLQQMPADQHRRVYSRVRAQHHEMRSRLFDLREILNENISAPPVEFM